MSSATGVRLTCKFNFAQRIRNSGWAESYDLAYTDLPTAQAARANIAAFLQDRCMCLGVGPTMVSATLIAMTQPATPGAPPQRRGTLEFAVPTPPAADAAYNKDFYSGSEILYADFSPTVYYINLQTNLSGTPVYRRNCWLAGLPDKSDQTNTGNITDPSTQVAVNKFIGDLNNSNPTLAGKCGVSIRSTDRSGANPIKQCTSWQIPQNTYRVPAHGFVVGQPVLAEGMKTVPGGRCPRGRYLIGIVVDENTISLQNSAAPTEMKKLGGFRADVKTFNVVADAQPQGFSKRNKGRPSGLSVGRSKRPLIARA